jgi:tetratricopeptide (TPR) repeat protein
MRSRRPRILLVLASAIAVSSAIAAPAQSDTRLEQWLGAVSRHEAGTFDEAAREISSWPDEHVNAVVRDVGELAEFLVRARLRFARSGVVSTTKVSGRRLTQDDVQQMFGVTNEEADAGDVGRLVMRAVLLHTDVTVEIGNDDSLLRARVSRKPRAAFLVSDGRHEGIGDTGPHWEISRALLDLLPPDSQWEPAKRQWYVAAAAFMRSRGHLAALLPHLTRALRIFPDDAEMRFYSGCMHEALASPSIQRAIRSLPTTTRTSVAVRDARTHFEQARAAFRAALDADPGHAEARARLGYVLLTLGEHEEAVSELQRVLAQRPHRPLQYLAALFLGGAHAQLGRRDAARAAYTRAAALYPQAQSPRLALSTLARTEGDRSLAARLLLPALPSTHDHTLRDPWWEYFGLPFDRAEQLLADWRRSIASGSEP